MTRAGSASPGAVKYNSNEAFSNPPSAALRSIRKPSRSTRPHAGPAALYQSDSRSMRRPSAIAAAGPPDCRTTRKSGRAALRELQRHRRSLGPGCRLRTAVSSIGTTPSGDLQVHLWGIGVRREGAKPRDFLPLEIPIAVGRQIIRVRGSLEARHGDAFHALDVGDRLIDVTEVDRVLEGHVVEREDAADGVLYLLRDLILKKVGLHGQRGGDEDGHVGRIEDFHV